MEIHAGAARGDRAGQLRWPAAVPAGRRRGTTASWWRRWSTASSGSLRLLQPADAGPAFRVNPFVNHYRNMAAYFDASRLKNAFTFQDLYVGLTPFDAPATFSMLSYSELAHGVWYPRAACTASSRAWSISPATPAWSSPSAHRVERIDTEWEQGAGGQPCRWVAGEGRCRPRERRPALCLRTPPPAGRDGRGDVTQAVLVFGDQLLLGPGQTVRGPGSPHAVPRGRLPRELQVHRPRPRRFRRIRASTSTPRRASTRRWPRPARTADGDRPGRSPERRRRPGLGGAPGPRARARAATAADRSASRPRATTSSSRRRTRRSRGRNATTW